MTARELAAIIDHTLLKAEATADQVQQICAEAVEYGFCSVCVNPVHVPLAARRLAGTTVKVGSVAGFPLGASDTAIKAEEAKRAVESGAREIDMVVNLGALISGEKDAVRDDIAAVADIVHAASPEYCLKVILESAVLTDEQLALGCRCVAEAQADFVKTSTGFHPAGGATARAVQLLKRLASPIKVKASGGIRTARVALAMVDAGADRLGCSNSVAIVEALQTSD